jgi:hypothetical protein
MVWIKLRRSSIMWPRIIDFGNGQSSENVIFVYSNKGPLEPKFALVKTLTSEEVIEFESLYQFNEWTHLTVTKARNETKTYINGTLTNRLPSSLLPANITRTSNYIGRSNWPNDQFADADMDDIKIFDGVLTDSDIRIQSLL